MICRKRTVSASWARDAPDMKNINYTNKSIPALIAVVILFSFCKNEEQKMIDASIKKLESDSPALVDEGLRGLFEAGPQAGRAIPAVARILNQGHPRLRPPAAAVLVKLDPEGKEVAPFLVEALGDKDAETRGQAARGIGLLQKPPPESVESLSKLENDSNLTVRAFACASLRRFHPSEKRYSRILTDIAVAGKGPERALAVSLLGDIAASDKDFDLSIFSRAVDDADTTVRLEAAAALAKQGPRADFAMEALMRAFEDPDESLSKKAVLAMNTIDPSGKKIIPALRLRVRHSELRVRLEAVAALSLYGEEGLSGVPELKLALMDSDSHVRLQAARSLGLLGSKTRAASSLYPLLWDRAPEVTYAAAEALARLGADSMPFFKQAMSDTRVHVRQRAVYGLGRMSPRPPEAEELLKKALTDTDSEVQNSARASLEAQ